MTQQHNPNCAIVRLGNSRAWCDCERKLDTVIDPNHTDTSRSGDLVDRLRWVSEWYFVDPVDGTAYASDDPLDAADRIEALEAENERLREAVEGVQEILAECSVSFGVCICGEDMQTHGTSHTPTDQAHIAVKRWLEEARAALGEKQ